MITQDTQRKLSIAFLIEQFGVTESQAEKLTDFLAAEFTARLPPAPGAQGDELEYMPTTDVAKPTDKMVDEAMDGFRTVTASSVDPTLRDQLTHALERALAVSPFVQLGSKSVFSLVDRWRTQSGEEGLHFVLKNALLNCAIELDEALAHRSPSSAIVDAASPPDSLPVGEAAVPDGWHVEGDPDDTSCPRGGERVKAVLDDGRIVEAYLGQDTDSVGWVWQMLDSKMHRTRHGQSRVIRVNVIAWKRHTAPTGETKE